LVGWGKLKEVKTNLNLYLNAFEEASGAGNPPQKLTNDEILPPIS
jgi:hypothetical protein